MNPDLNRKVRIYLSRTGGFAHAEVGSQTQADILSASKGYRLCASVDSDHQASSIIDKLCHYPGDSVYLMAGLTCPPTEAELKWVAARIETVYQSMKHQTGEIVP
jgi:hypothetical protein